jgi:hypothetical protein
MSYDTKLTRLNASDFQEFLATDGKIGFEIFDKASYSVEDDIPSTVEVRKLFIDEHPLCMFINTAGDNVSVFHTALFEGKHRFFEKDPSNLLTYLDPADVQEAASQMAQFTDEALRNLFALTGPYTDAEAFAADFDYANVDALLALQKEYYQRILRFFQQAAASGDAIGIAFN